MTDEEAPFEPERPIIDPHLHLWDILPAPGAPQEPQRWAAMITPRASAFSKATQPNCTTCGSRTAPGHRACAGL